MAQQEAHHRPGCGVRNPPSYTLHPAPYTLHPTPNALHPTPCTLHPTPCTLHPAPYTLHPTHYTLHPTPHTLHPTPYTLHPTPYTLHHSDDEPLSPPTSAGVPRGASSPQVTFLTPTEETLSHPVDHFTRPMAPMPSQWLQHKCPFSPPPPSLHGTRASCLTRRV